MALPHHSLHTPTLPDSNHPPAATIIGQKLVLQPVAATTRRTAIALILLARLEKDPAAFAFDFRLVAPDQTLEEAQASVGGHAEGLLRVKELLEEESWREAQKELRKASASLKQDIYTIIQGRAGAERPRLRKLYSELFNGVTALDFAARDKDKTRVWESYGNIVVALREILSKL